MAQINRQCVQFLIDIGASFLNVDQGAYGEAVAHIMYARPISLVWFADADPAADLSERDRYSGIRWACAENSDKKGGRLRLGKHFVAPSRVKLQCTGG